MASAPKDKKEKEHGEEWGGCEEKGENIGKSEGRMLNGFDRRTGGRNRCFTCNSDYQFAPQCPRKESRGEGPNPSTCVWKEPSRPPYSSIAVESPISVQTDGYDEKSDQRGKCGRPLSATLDLGGQFLCVREDCVVALGAGAAANLVLFNWLENHNLLLGTHGFPGVSTYPTGARFEFGDGRQGEARLAADISVGNAGAVGALTAFAFEADSPALLRKGILEATGGQSACTAVMLTLRNHELGHYVFIVVSLGKGPPSLDRGPKLTASYFEWACAKKRPDLADGGLHIPLSQGGLYRREPPRIFPAGKAGTLGGARNGCLSDAKKIIMKLHVDWGHASAQQLKRAPVDTDGENMPLVNYVAEVLEHCEVRRAFDKAPHVAIAGASTVSLPNGNLQIGLSPLDEIIALRAVDVYSKYSLLLPERSKHPQEVWDAFGGE